MLYSIGEKCPLELNAVQEGIYPVVDNSMFIACALYSNVNSQEIKGWSKTGIKYGVFTKEKVPFFLIQIPGCFDFCMAIDIEIEKPENVEKWKNIGNLLNLVLCDYPTRIIKAMRVIGIESSIMADFKDKTFVANKEFKGGLLKESYRIQDRYSNQQMMDRSSMRSSKNAS